MAKQLDMFEQQRKESYQEYYNRFYAKQLKEAAKSRAARKEIKPLEVIMISTGEVRQLTTDDLKHRKHE